ncbi:hypothetical protein GGF32_007465 [Allomyces javanicus]|nr:hypothetical protein GGF32_007465 [Allomyces javanicus]
MSDPSAIQVFVRVRPFNARELAAKSDPCVSVGGPVDEAVTIVVPPSATPSTSGTGSISRASSLRPTSGAAAAAAAAASSASSASGADDKKTFFFDRCFQANPALAPQDEQNHLFGLVARPLLDHAFEGYNVCLFAYGQTGSGKSYTMMGAKDSIRGVIPLASGYLFDQITQRANDPSWTVNVEVSYLEIYCEKVKDLLNPMNKAKLRVREHPMLGPYVEDLTKMIVTSSDGVLRLIDTGNQLRTVASTQMNDVSSRSHAVFQIILTQKKYDEETNMSTERVSRISFVDLAGSERANSTGASGQRLKEGANINKSLSALGKVISALAELSGGASTSGGSKQRATHVPYRDSVLTWLLKDSLGGNSRTVMISCVSPASINAPESLSTLRYSDRAKQIVNKAIVNEDPNAKLIRELKAEIAELRERLAAANSPSSSPSDASPAASVLNVTVTQLRDQLSASEKLMVELNETWEEKLRRTQEIAAEKERVLNELGIRIGNGQIGITSPTRYPHLLNTQPNSVNDSLVISLLPGRTTLGSGSDMSVVLAHLASCHATIWNTERAVLLQPRAPDVFINGVVVARTTLLQSGDSLRLRDYRFRYVHPRRMHNPDAAPEEAKDKEAPEAPGADPAAVVGGLLRDQFMWRRAQRALFGEVRQLCTALKKANVMAKELDRPVMYQLAIHDRALDDTTAASDRRTVTGAMNVIGGRPNDLSLAVRVYDLATNAVGMWSVADFNQRLDAMEQIYSHNTQPDRDPFMPDHAPRGQVAWPDVFVDPESKHTMSLVGVARIPVVERCASERGGLSMHARIVATHQYMTILGTLHVRVAVNDARLDLTIMELSGVSDAVDDWTIAVRVQDTVQWTDTMHGFGTGTIPYLSILSFPLTAGDSTDEPVIHVRVFGRYTVPLAPLALREVAQQPRQAPTTDRGVGVPPRVSTGSSRHVLCTVIQIRHLDPFGFFVPCPVDHPRDNVNRTPPRFRLRHGMVRRVVLVIYSPPSMAGAIAVDRIELANWRWITAGPERASGSANAVASPQASTGSLPSASQSQPAQQVIRGGKPLSLPILKQTQVQRAGLLVSEVECAWDSSLHDFFYLNRATPARGSPDTGYLMATVTVGMAAGWTLVHEVRMISEVRPVSGVRPESTSTASSSADAAPVVAQAALTVWNAQPAPAYLGATEYVRGEESLGAFQVLGARDGGAGLVSRAMEHAEWVTRLREVERTRAWLGEHASPPAASPTPSEATMRALDADGQLSSLSEMLSELSTSVGTVRTVIAPPPVPPKATTADGITLSPITEPGEEGDAAPPPVPPKTPPEPEPVELSPPPRNWPLPPLPKAETRPSSRTPPPPPVPPKSAYRPPRYLSPHVSPIDRVKSPSRLTIVSTTPTSSPPPSPLPPATTNGSMPVTASRPSLDSLDEGSELGSTTGSSAGGSPMSPVGDPRLWALTGAGIQSGLSTPAGSRHGSESGEGAELADDQTSDETRRPDSAPSSASLLLQTVVSMWSRPSLVRVLPADARVHLFSQTPSARKENMLCGLVGSLPHVTKRGYLLHHVGSNWAKMWVVIRRPFVFLYETNDELTEVGFVHLINAKLEYQRDAAAGSEAALVFALQTPDFSYYFKTGSEDELVTWISSVDPLHVAALQSNRQSMTISRKRGPGQRSSIADLAAAFFRRSSSASFVSH